MVIWLERPTGETCNISLPKLPSPQGKAMFGLKTDWFYHQPEPWMKSFPLKLSKQLWATLTPCSQLLKPTGFIWVLPSPLGLPHTLLREASRSPRRARGLGAVAPSPYRSKRRLDSCLLLLWASVPSSAQCGWPRWHLQTAPG